MLKFLFRILFPLFLTVISLFANGQKYDTVKVEFNQLLLLRDTIYYGINDSVVVVDAEEEYELVRNFLVRELAYYERKPHRKESVKRLHGNYVRLLMGNIHNRKEDLPEDFNPSDNYYTFYRDRVIKDIYVEGVAVLDGNVLDTTTVKKSRLGRFLNKTYQPTRERIVRNNLKFKPNQKLNPRIFSDNERLLRNLSYIEDAKIKIVPVEGSSDSVNVIVITKDKYPIGIGGDVNDYNHFEIEPYTRNYKGLGHNVGLIFQYDGSADKKFGYGAYYAVNNIAGSFINGESRFNKGLDRDFFSIEFEKPFLTTNTRFGGEMAYEARKERIFQRDDIIDSLYSVNSKYSVDLFDIWSGYSFLFNNDLYKPFLNIAGRFYVEKYKERPEEWFEFNYPFHDKQLFLASLSLQKVSYIKTSKLLQFGKIEDVPVGFNFNATMGWEHTSFFNRPYWGARLNYSTFGQNAGIFYTEAEIGGYRYHKDFEDVVSGIKFNYLSPLGSLGNFELRNIFEISYTSLTNPRYLIPIVFTNYELDIEEYGVLGDANLEFVYRPFFYSPYNLAGFRFSFTPFIDVGWLQAPDLISEKVDFYSVLGLSAAMKNESLIFPAMHLLVGYYLNEVRNEPRFEIKVVFKDYKLFRDFTSLKPRTAHPSNFY